MLLTPLSKSEYFRSKSLTSIQGCFFSLVCNYCHIVYCYCYPNARIFDRAIFVYVFLTFATFPSNLMEAAEGGNPFSVMESSKFDGNVENVRKHMQIPIKYSCMWISCGFCDIFLTLSLELFI